MRLARQRETLSRWCSALLCLALGSAFVWGVWRQTSGFEVWTFEGRRQLQVAAGKLQAPVVQLRNADGSAAPTPWRPDSVAPAAYLVDFIYTRCPGVCRVLGNEYQQMQAQLLERSRQDPAYYRVQLLSLSFDVAHDDVRQLQATAVRMGARQAHWRFAVPASEVDSQSLLRALGVVAIADGAGGFVHNGDIHLLDREGRLRALFRFDEWPRALAAARALAAR
ncbi:MAG: SCO family protein [Ideonella sp.]